MKVNKLYRLEMKGVRKVAPLLERVPLFIIVAVMIIEFYLAILLY